VLFHDDLLEGFGLSAEDSAALHAIMAVGSREARIPGLAPGLLAPPDLRPGRDLAPIPGVGSRPPASSILGVAMPIHNPMKTTRQFTLG
jgi:hypothetical protein